MVPVPSRHGADPVQQQRLPFRPVPREHFLHADPAVHQHVPHAVAFHVVLVDDIQPQLVAQAVKGAAVGIVAGAHGVDVVPLHQDQVPPDLLLRHGPARLPAEVVPVHPLEDHPHPVHPDHAVHDLNLPESRFHRNNLRVSSGGDEPQRQVVEIRILRRPQPRPGNLQASGDFRLPAGAPRLLSPGLPVPAQRQGVGRVRRRADPRLPAQHALLHLRVRLRLDLQIPHVGLRHRVQEHLPVQPGEPEEVLILQPAARAEAVHPAGQLVLPLRQRLRQLKLVGREAVGGKADVFSVKPYGHAALRPLEGDENPLPPHLLRQREMLHVAGHRVEPLRNLPGHQRLVPRPGVLGVGILGRAVSFPLNVGRNPDLLPSPAVVSGLLKAFDHLSRVHRVEEFPYAVQAHPQGVVLRLHVLLAGIPRVVCMGIQSVFPEVSGIL